MKTITNTLTSQIVISKSKFIANIIPVNSIEDISNELSTIKKKYYDATHNCYAYILGDTGEVRKCSDDGEPSKTAGFPILDVLMKNTLTNVLCVVTRYFGGTLLGTGGLIRAYSQATIDAINDATFYEKRVLLNIQMFLDYSSYNNILNELNNYVIIDSSFTDEVKITVAIKDEIATEFKKHIKDITKGKAIMTDLGYSSILEKV